MKHFIKKRIFAGAGGKREKPKPKPTVLRPPDIGKFSVGSSYSIVEIIDLISDGPIHSLVNQNGEEVNSTDIFQAVYLNNTPIAVSTVPTPGANTNAETSYIYKIDSTDFNARLKNFSERIDGEDVYKTSLLSDKLKNCFFNYESAAAYSEQRRFAAISFPWLENKGKKSEKTTLLFTDAVSNDTNNADYNPWQPVFSNFFGGLSVPPYYDHAKIISNDLASIDSDSFATYYNKDVAVASNRLYLKLKDSTATLDDSVPWYSNQTNTIEKNQKIGKSTIEVHYSRGSLNSNGSILSDYLTKLNKITDSTINSSRPISTYAGNQKNIINKFLTEYDLGTDDALVQKFDENNASNSEDTTIAAKFAPLSSPIRSTRPSNKCFIIIKLGDNNWSDSADYAGGAKGINSDSSIYIPNSENIDEFSVFIPNLPDGITIHSLVTPYLNDNIAYKGNLDKMTGLFFGCIILEIPLTLQNSTGDNYNLDGSTGKTAKWGTGADAKYRSWRTARWFFPDFIDQLKNKNFELLFIRKQRSTYRANSDKFNFSNVLCEFKNGKEFQDPLKYFNNIHVDFEYNAPLYGAYRRGGEIQRVKQDIRIKDGWDEYTVMRKNDPARNGGPAKLNSERGNREGSSDTRNTTVSSRGKLAYNKYGEVKVVKIVNGKIKLSDPTYNTKNYSNWDKESNFDDSDVPIVHTIENPNVTSVYFTLGISSLKDTVNITPGDPAKAASSKLQAGDSIPAILVINVTWGVTRDGIQDPSGDVKFSIVAQIESMTLVDFGWPELVYNGSSRYDYIFQGAPGSDFIRRPGAQRIPFQLPPITEKDNISGVKRFIKITKVSVETNSVLISKDCSLIKVTEIIDSNLSYPFSAINGIKLDSRSFGSIPDRSYDCRLKVVKIPSNYYPLADSNGSDRRYISKASDYKIPQKIYVGDWDGTFKDGWTDNPAWILYDLLTSQRYGLGGYIDESQINIWELYKIGRFCDSVNDDGYFIGVSDGIGGLEPRYSCNIMFKDNIKVFDAINIVSNLFRGSTFFSNSEVHFLDDRPRTPIATFSNSNVKDGFFSYTNNRRDQQFNTVEVVYLDRFDNFKTKIEFVEDEASIRKRGVLKTTINTNGVTSRAMARRMGKHLIYQTIKENQSVEFKAGLESLLCRPGDLIIVDDEMKTRDTNYGRVLDVNLEQKSLYIENKYSDEKYIGKLTVYTPTGYATSQELSDLAKSNRSRVDNFDFNSNLLLDSDLKNLTGNYSFDKYTNGYTGGTSQNYFGSYTGYNFTNKQNLFCYYNTGVSGWVFSTGKAFSDNNLYDKIIFNTGIDNILSINGLSGFLYDTSIPNRRGSAKDLYTGIKNFIGGSEKGILNEEISTINYPQIKTFNITGFDNQDYGCNLYLNTGDPNINLLSFVKVGSPYRIERSGAANQIYKILSIREENQNEYNIVGSKYDTGKYELIENFTVEDYLPDTYYAGTIKVNNYEINQLEAPYIQQFVTGKSSSNSFTLSGVWDENSKATGFEVNLYNKTVQYSQTYFVANNVGKYEFQGLTDLGTWTLEVKALGDKHVNLDSDYSRKDTFVMYQGITLFDRPLVKNFTIL